MRSLLLPQLNRDTALAEMCFDFCMVGEESGRAARMEEKELDFFSHPVSDTHHHNQEECIRDGMKSEALVFSNVYRTIYRSGP